MLHTLSETNMSFVCSFSPLLRSIHFLLPIALIWTYFQNKHVAVVLVNDNCILLMEKIANTINISTYQ